MNDNNFKTKECARCWNKKYHFLFSTNDNVCKSCRAEYAQAKRTMNIGEWREFYQQWKGSIDFSREAKHKKTRESKNEKKRLALEKKKFQQSNQMQWAIRTRISHKLKNVIRISSIEIAEMALRTLYCPVCNIELTYKKEDRNLPNKATLDRINNSLIVDKDSVQILCRQCNSFKGTKTMEEFIEHFKKIVHRYKHKGDKNE